MLDYKTLKQRAVKLRKNGLSYKEIKEKIPVAKSSLSLWLKSVPLKPEYRQRLYTKQIEVLSRGPNSQRERRKREIEKIIQEAAKEIKSPSIETLRLFGAALYWAEGSKNKKFEITNSDPHLILFFVKWVEKVFKLSPLNFKIRLNIYPQQNEKKIKKFWSYLTGIPLENFGKTFIKPISSGYKKNNLYYGTAKVYIPKSVDNIHRVFGWIKTVLDDIPSQVDFVQKKWVSLTKVNRPVNLK